MTKRKTLKAFIYIVCVTVQVASSEQMLSVEIAHFETMYNSTIKFGNYCCCDDSDSSSCVKTLETLQKCPTACDPYFRVYFDHCTYSPNKTCTVLTKPIDFSFDPASEISPILFQIPFKQLDLELYNQVRICSYIINNMQCYN